MPKRTLRPYEMLSQYYSRDWASYGLQYADLVAQIERSLGRKIVAIVDLACGIGALTAELHKRGYRVIGVDLCPEMIGLARVSSPDIEYIMGDLATAVLPCKMDLAVCSFDSLNYFTDAARLQIALANVHRMLRPGGLFVFDINTPHLYEEKHHGAITREAAGVRFQQILAYDVEARVATTTFDFGDSGVEVHVQRAYERDELEGYLKSARFEVLGVYQDFRMNPAFEGALKPIFLAERPMTRAEWLKREP